MDSMDAFGLFLLKRGCRANTIKRRQWNLRHVSDHLGGLDKITPEAVDAYLFELLQAHKKATYLNTLMDAVRSYGDFKQIEALKHIRNLKEDDPVKSILSDEEIEKILNLPCPQRHVISKFGKPFTRRIGEKNWNSHTMFFTLLAYTGARPNEIAKLSKTQDILWGQDLISIKKDKTGKNRLLPIPSTIKKPLEAYCSGLEGDYLFKAKNASGFINSVTWCDAFHKRLKRAGINERPGLTVYSLRHSFITSLLEEDVSFPRVMQLAGHSRAETTLKYTHLCVKKLKSAVDKLPLIQGHKNPEEKIRQFMLQAQEFQANNKDVDCEIKNYNGHLLIDLIANPVMRSFSRLIVIPYMYVTFYSVSMSYWNFLL